MPAVSETRIAVRFIDKATAELTKAKNKYEDFSDSVEKSAQKSINLWHRAGILTAGLGSLMKTIANTDEETKKMTDTFTTGVIAAGSFMTAIGELRSNFQDLLPDITSTTKALKEFIKTSSKKELALLGLAGASVATAGYAIYAGAKEKYDAYQNGQALEVLDEYGNTISYTHDLTKTSRISGDDADHYQILQKDANGKAYDYNIKTTAEKATKSLKNIMPKSYTISVPIGELVRDKALLHPEGEKWIGNVTADASKQCDSYLASLYEAVGAGFERAIVNDTDFKAKGAYHEAGKGYTPEVGDMVDFLSHVGVYMGNGMIQSRQSQGGVKTISLAEAEKFFGQIQGFGSLREATGGKMATITLDEQGKKIREMTAETAANYGRLQRIFADLNSEITNMNGNASEYDKFMDSVTAKLASYQKDMALAQNSGLDISPIQAKMEEYFNAASNKGIEIKQDEVLKRMHLEEQAITRMGDLGYISIENQRSQYAEKLEEHRQYLETIISQTTENNNRRIELENQLADTMRQINENSVYNFKTGWQQALTELANQQINFKDHFISSFDSIENSLVTLVSSTGSAKDKFKQFCQDVTNTILKSMTQIIIRGLITKAIMGAIGLGGGGGISVGSVSNSWASSFNGGSLFTPGGIGTFASGGDFKAGQTALVGEQGPELVRFGSAGRVYNNSETKSMLGGSLENVKVEVINQSGQEVKADNANVKFDGKTLIISTVIEAVNNNYMGMRSMLKGVATT